MEELIKKGATDARRWMRDPGARKFGFTSRFKTEIERLPVDWTYIVLLVLLSVWLIVLSGCALRGQQLRQQTPEAFEKTGYPESLAVLPFSNQSASFIQISQPQTPDPKRLRRG